MQLGQKPGLLPLSKLLALSDSEFRNLFSGTPVRRAGYKKFIRNCLIAAGNSHDITLIPLIIGYLDDETLFVQASAIWALRQLCEENEFQRLKNGRNDSHKELVKEWNANK